MVRSKSFFFAFLMIAPLTIAPQAWGTGCGDVVAGKLQQYRAVRDRLSGLRAGKDLAAYCSALKQYLATRDDVVELLWEARACPEVRGESTADAIESESSRLIGDGVAKCLALEPEKR